MAKLSTESNLMDSGGGKANMDSSGRASGKKAKTTDSRESFLTKDVSDRDTFVERK